MLPEKTQPYKSNAMDKPRYEDKVFTKYEHSQELGDAHMWLFNRMKAIQIFLEIVLCVGLAYKIVYHGEPLNLLLSFLGYIVATRIIEKARSEAAAYVGAAEAHAVDYYMYKVKDEDFDEDGGPGEVEE